MSEPTDPGLQDVALAPARQSLLERVSIVWLVPFGALVLALALAWQAYTARGPLIEITFSNGSGIAAGETELRFRDITVGRVEAVGFTDGLERVRVSVRLDEQVVPYVDAEAAFWVVRPEVTAQGIRGLTTVLSGVYIEGSWDAEPGGLETAFVGLDEVPVARPDEEGTRIILRSETGRGLTQGAPILYRGLEVGEVGAPRIATDGITVLAQAFVRAPHDSILTDRSRFWSTSGFSVSVGAQGAAIDFGSLATLLRGGLVVDTLVAGGAPLPPGAFFDIFPDRDAALESLFAPDDATVPRLNVTAVFSDNVTGLEPGAPVTLQGLEIGEVTDIIGQVDPERFGDDRVRLVATLSIRLSEVSMGAAQGSQSEVLDFLESRVAEGLRARLASGALLSGGLKVEIVELPDAAPAALDRDAVPFPVVPTAPADIEDLGEAAQGLIARINALPVERLLDEALGAVSGLRALVEADGLQRVPGEVADLVADLRAVVGSEDVQALPAQLGGIATALTDALREFEAQDGVAGLLEAVAAAGDAARQIGAAVEGVPDLVARLDAVAASAEGLELRGLVDAAGGVLAEVRAVLADADLKALPADLRAALAALDGATAAARDVLAEVTAEGTVAALTATLDATTGTVQALDDAIAGVPDLVARLDAVAASAEGLELRGLVDEAGGVLADLRGVLGAQELQQLPAEVSAALRALDGAIRQAEVLFEGFNAEETPARVTAAADAAAVAAGDVSAAIADVPDLVAELEAVAVKARGLALEDLVDEAAAALAEARALIGTEAAQGLPARSAAALDELTAAVADARRLIAQVEQGGSVASLNAALEAAARAADDVSASVAGVPDLVAQVEAVAARAEALEIEPLLAQVAALAEAGRDLIDTEAARALPGQMGGALDELSAALAELRAGGTVANVNATLSSARRAADAVAASSEDLPGLVARTDAVLQQAEAVLAGLGEAGALNREARTALREVGRAAEAVRALARALERRPNAILTGR